MKINLQEIDRTQFDVKTQPGKFPFIGEDLTLITPRKDKHTWEDHELWLRSVVTDAEGKVVSMGFPKFMNYHERPDHHEEALQNANRVYSLDKLDGTLIILSFPKGKHYLRTRGSAELGDFHEPVHRLITELYNPLWDKAVADLYGDKCSLLFEYIAPTNQIVVQYQHPTLIFLGYVDWSVPPFVDNDPECLQAFERGMGIPAASVLHIGDPKQLMQDVRSWDQEKNSEGIVVCCEDEDYQVTMFKVKSEWYLMMHALRFQMTPKKLMMLLVLEYEEIFCFEDLKDYLYTVGYDFEIANILEKETNTYFDRLNAYECELAAFFAAGEPMIHLVLEGESTRKDFVYWVRKYMEEHESSEWLFSAAMTSLDRRSTYNYCLAAAAGVSVRKVQDWLKDKEALQKTLLKTPEDFENEEV